MNWKTIRTLFLPFSALLAGFTGCGADKVSDERVGTAEQAVHDEGLFQLDGNAQQSLNSTPPAADDWDNVLLGAGGLSVANTGVVNDPTGTTIFFGGGSKDTNNLNQWRFSAGSSPPKADITNAYAALYRKDNPDPQADETIVYFGLDRFDTSGATTAGFWFFQNQVSLLPSGRFSGLHAIGDILVVADFGGSGAPQIKIFKWVGSGGSDGALDLLADDATALCGSSVNDDACAITNATAVAAPWPYTGKNGLSPTFPAGAFFEGGIDLSALGLGSVCFSSFLAETRSSNAAGSSLQDFVIGEFDTCALTVSKTCEVTNRNADGTFRVDFHATVTNSGTAPLPSNTVITVVDNAATANNPNDDVTVSVTQGLAAGASVTLSGFFVSSTNPPAENNIVTATAVFNGTTLTATSLPEACDALAPAEFTVVKTCRTQLESQNNLVAVRVNFDVLICNQGTVPIKVDNIMNSREGLPPENVPFPAGLTIPPRTDPAIPSCATVSSSYLPTLVPNVCPGSAQFSDTVSVTATNGSTLTVSASDSCGLCEANNCPAP